MFGSFINSIFFLLLLLPANFTFVPRLQRHLVAWRGSVYSVPLQHPVLITAHLFFIKACAFFLRVCSYFYYRGPCPEIRWIRPDPAIIRESTFSKGLLGSFIFWVLGLGVTTLVLPQVLHKFGVAEGFSVLTAGDRFPCSRVILL